MFMEAPVPTPIIDCPQVSGKTVQSLKVYTESEGGCEAVIEFTDGTAFSCCVGHKPYVKAQLYVSGIATPEILFEQDA